MMIYDKILTLVFEALKGIAEDQENEALINVTEETRLFGENLDSMGIIFFVTELEELISEEFGLDIALADERAMSQKSSPFRSVKILVKYVQELIEEEQAKQNEH
jgi:acyl carrier protein